MKKFILIPVLAMLFVGCTENSSVRRRGGTMTVKLETGKKLVNATWKDGDNLWYLVRVMRTNEVPETTEFVEKSSYGLNEGKVVFEESR